MLEWSTDIFKQRFLDNSKSVYSCWYWQTFC